MIVAALFQPGYFQYLLLRFDRWQVSPLKVLRRLNLLDLCLPCLHRREDGCNCHEDNANRRSNGYSPSSVQLSLLNR
jgi:hypothetical protein